MIIDDHAQVSGHRLGMQAQEGARREVHDPEVVDAGSFKSLGGTGNVLAQEIADTAATWVRFAIFTLFVAASPMVCTRSRTTNERAPL